MSKRRLSIFSLMMIIISSILCAIYAGSDAYAFSFNPAYSVLNDCSSRYYYSLLDDEQKDIYDDLENKFRTECFDEKNNYNILTKSVSIIVYDMPKEKVEQIAEAFHLDHYFFYWTYTYCYGSGNANVIKISRESRYNIYSEKDIQDQYKELSEKSSEVLREVSKYATDTEKAYYIYTWITDNSGYAYDGNGDPSDLPIDHSMYGNIINKKSVCEGYAETFAYLCTLCGIENSVVVGDAIRENGSKEAHAWNIIKLDGKYYYIDTTWDTDSEPENYMYAFKAINDELFNKTHAPETSFHAPSEADQATSDLDLTKVKDAINNAKYETISLNLNPANCKFRIYNNGIEVPINNNQFTVMENTEVEFISADSRSYSFYKGTVNTDNVIKNGKLIVSNIKNNTVCVEVGKPKIKDIKLLHYSDSTYWGNLGGYIQIDTESDSIQRYIDFTMTLDDNTTNKANSLNSIDCFHPADIDPNKLPGERAFRAEYNDKTAENDNLSLDSDSYIFDINGTYYNYCLLTLVNQNGIEPKAYDEEGRRLYSGTKVPYGTHVTLKAYSLDGKIPDKFWYNDSKISNQEIDDKGFIITEDTSITCVNSVLDINKIDYIKEVNVNNGTLPNPDLLGLSTSALIETKDGFKKSFPITWDLSNYDYLDKSSNDITVKGKINIQESTYTLSEGLSTDIETIIHITNAKELKSLETDIPSSLTVPAGTARNPYSLGLPIVAELKNKEGDIIKSEIIWTAEEGNPYKMIGTIKRNGYSFDDITVNVTEEGNQLINVPSVSVYYSINNIKTNILSPVESESIIAHITVQSINTHKDRIIKVHIPKGFTDAGVADASYLQGVNNVQLEKNEDNTTDVYVEVDDSFKDGNLTFDVSMKSIFNNSDLDIGKLYPSFSDIPLIINYDTKENNIKTNCDLDYSDHLRMGGGNEYIAEPKEKAFFSRSLALENYQKNEDIYNFKIASSKNTSYLNYFQVIYPVEESFYCTFSTTPYWYESYEFDDTTNSIFYTRNPGTVYESLNDSFAIKGCAFTYSLHAKDEDSLAAGVRYSSDNNIYAIGEDYFGNEYIRNYDNKMSLYIFPYDENSNVNLEVSPYSLVSDNSEYYNMDLSLDIAKSTSLVSLKPLNDMQIYIDIPDGTTVVGTSILQEAESIEFIYHDNSSFTLTRKYANNKLDDKKTNGNFLLSPTNEYLSVSKDYSNWVYYLDDKISKKSSDGIKEMIIHMKPITDSYKDDMQIILSGAHKYPDGSRVNYGSSFQFTNNIYEYITDCPISDMPVNVHTDYTDFTVDSKTIHRLDESGTGWTAFSEYEDPYKNSNNIFTGKDEYELFEMTSEGYPQKLIKDVILEDTIISSALVQDPEVFFIKSITYSSSRINYEYSSDATIRILCTDGNTYDYDLVSSLNKQINAPEGEGILDYNIYIDELCISEDNKIIVTKTYTVDWDKYLEKGYQNDATYKITEAAIDSRNCVGSYCDGLLLVPGDVTFKPFVNYSSIVRTYDDEEKGAITAISSFEQMDGCTETYTFTYSNSYYLNSKQVYDWSDLSYPVLFDDIVIGVSTGNGQLRLNENDKPKLYDKNNNLIAEADSIECKPINTYYLYYANIGNPSGNTYDDMLYKIHFKNITLTKNDSYSVSYRIEPTSKIKPGTYTSYTNVLSLITNKEANSDAWSKTDYASVHRTLKSENHVLSKMFQSLYRTYKPADINVLTAYSENATMYGNTTADTDPTLESYNVENEETYNSILHLFTGSDNKLNSFSAVISIPKSSNDHTVNGKLYDNTYDSTLVSIIADSYIVNPHYYYKKANDSDFIEFSGDASEVENPEDITTIMITADSVSNNDEINIQLKAPYLDSKAYTYIYSDINYIDGDKERHIVSNVVEYVLNGNLEPIDPPLGGEEPKKIATIQIDSSISIIDSCINEEDLNDITFELRKGNGDTEGELIKSIKLGDEFEKNESGVYSIKTPIEVELSGDEPEDYYIVESSYEREKTDVKISHNTENSEPSDGNKAAFKLSTNDNAKIIFANEYKTKELEPIDPPLGGEETKKTAQIQIEKSISIIDECVTEEDLKNITFELRLGNGETESELISSYSLSEDFNKNEDGTFSLKNPIEVELEGDDPIDYYITEKSYTVDGKEITINHNLENKEPSTGDKISFKLAADNNLKIFFASEYKSESGPIIDPPLGGETKKTANIFIEQSLNVNDNCIDDEFIKGITYELRLGNGETEGELVSYVTIGNDFEVNEDGIYILTNPIVVELSGDEPIEYYIIKTSYTKEGVKTALTHNLENEEPAEGDKISFSLSADDNSKVIFTSEYNLEVPKIQEETSEEPKVIPSSSQVSPEEPSTEELTSEELTEEITTEELTEEITTEESTTEVELGQEIATNESSEPVTEVNQPDNLKKETTVTQNPKQDDNKNIVGTGDNTYIIVLMILMIISLAGTISIIIYKKQK